MPKKPDTSPAPGLPISLDLEKLVNRTHPEYAGKIDHWKFCRLSYLGGREWFGKKGDRINLFKFYKEGPKEHEERVHRTYRGNHTKRVVDTVNQFLFRQPPVRTDKAPELIKKFWGNTDGKNLTIDRLMKDVDRWMSVYGRPWVAVDRAPQIANVRSEEKIPYAYIVSPERIKDFAYDTSDRKLKWLLIEEDRRDDSIDGGDTQILWRLWTRTEWYLIREGSKKDGEEKFVIDRWATHGLGAVPFVSIAENDDNKFASAALIDDIVYMDRTLVNYGSLLDEILYEQTFSTMTLPVEGLVPGSKDAENIINASKNRLFLYSSTTGNGKPEFISPDVTQAGLIVGAMTSLKKDIYAVTGTDNDANSQSMSKGKEYASGKVREFDHKQIENILLDKARALEEGEERILELVNLWMGQKPDVDENWVSYPDKFDVRGLATELEIAAEMNELKLPEDIMRRQVKLIAAKAFTRMTVEEKMKLDSLIEEWIPGYSQELQIQNREVAAKELTADAQMLVAKTPQPKPAAPKAAPIKTSKTKE